MIFKEENPELKSQPEQAEKRESVKEMKDRLHLMGIELADLYGDLRKYQDERKDLKDGTGEAEECDYWIAIFRQRIQNMKEDMNTLSSQIAERMFRKNNEKK